MRWLLGHLHFTCIAALHLFCQQEECSRCYRCKRRVLQSGERTFTCPICCKSWHESCAVSLSSELTHPEILASLTEQHSCLLHGLTSCFVSSVAASGIDDLWGVLTRASTTSCASSSSSARDSARQYRYSAPTASCYMYLEIAYCQAASHMRTLPCASGIGHLRRSEVGCLSELYTGCRLT